MSALPHRRAAYAYRDDGRVPALRHVHRWASDPKNHHGFPKLSMYWCFPGGIASVSERNRPYGNAMGTSAVCRRAVVKFSGGNGAPEEIRTPDPQIRSLVGTVEIIEVRYRKKRIGLGSS